MSCMLVPWPLLRAIFFFLEKILNSSPLPCAGFARPAGRPAFTWPSSLWCLPPACRLGLPECTALWVQLWQQTSLCHLQERGGGPRLTVARSAADWPASCLTPHFSLAASLLQDRLAGSCPPNCLLCAGQAGEFTWPSPADVCRSCPPATGQPRQPRVDRCWARPRLSSIFL